MRTIGFILLAFTVLFYFIGTSLKWSNKISPLWIRNNDQPINGQIVFEISVFLLFISAILIGL